MKTLTAVSRRDVLKFAGAAGGLSVAAGLRSAWAQPAPRIERLDPALDRILSASQPVRELGSGYGGNLGPAEGPVWWKEGGYLLFSDIHNNKRMKYVPGQGVSLFQEPTNRANGLTRDLQGRLLACEHDTRRVTRLEQSRHREDGHGDKHFQERETALTGCDDVHRCTHASTVTGTVTLRGSRFHTPTIYLLATTVVPCIVVITDQRTS
jgi:hypothetical protein